MDVWDWTKLIPSLRAPTRHSRERGNPCFNLGLLLDDGFPRVREGRLKAD